MNVSLSWLRAVAPGIGEDVHELAEHLALRGAPVEELAWLAEGLDGCVAARVLEVREHPNADRLTLCTVDAGTDGTLQVVCGAPNVRADALYPFAPVGTALPGGMAIRKAKIRGEASEGMLCSAKELGVGTDASGLLELPGGEPGASLVEVLGLDDWRLDVEVTPNRGDLLSHVGVARELAPTGHAGLVSPALPDAPEVAFELVADPREVSAGGATVRIEDPDLCLRYIGAVVRGVRVGPSPEWLQKRLRAVGARPISNVVDATNYAMLELGQPMHAFDLAALADDTIVVRRAGEGASTFTTLDGEERTLSPDMLMICDAERPVAIAGVMGGLDSEVGDETTDILLECALFHPASVRGTRRALGMSTDASYRFERGVDPEGLEVATRRALELILATAGGTLEPRVADCRPVTHERRRLELRLERVARVLGVTFTAAEARDLLEPLGFQVSTDRQDEGVLEVTVPGYRSYDVTREIDLVEEVARTHGYDRFPQEVGPYRASSVPDDPVFQLEDELRTMLAERGLFECQTPAFVSERLGDVEVKNPVSQDERHLRRDVLPSVVGRVEYNVARGQRDVRLFELATSFRAGEGDLPHEEPRLAVALCGRSAPPHWSEQARSFDLWDVRGLLADVGERIDPAAKVKAGVPDEARSLSPEGFTLTGGDGRVLGWGGRIRDEHLDVPPWVEAVWGLEVALRRAEAGVRTYEPLPGHPHVDRDLAVVAAPGVASGAIERILREHAGDTCVDVGLFDCYTGSGVPEGHRSLAYRLRFQAEDRTLTDEEVDATMARLRQRLQEELGVRFRG